MPSHATRRADLARPCRQCGVTFWPYQARSRYCSRICMAAGFSTRVERSCEICSAAFTAIPAEIAKGKGRYCSKTCAAVATSRRGGTAEERFWLRVNKTETCWLWTGALDKDGYGVSLDKRAHRHSWIIGFGPIPDGMSVLHSCDAPPCVRPGHLFLGTTRDNVDDKIAKGRQAIGERIASAKTTENDVREMRRLRSEGMKLVPLSQQFGLSVATISHIVRRDTWRHVD